MSHLPHALPSPRTLDAAAAPALRWGVLGTGWIAERFIWSVQLHTRQRFTAIGSRNPERSAAFAARLGVPGWYGSYEELVADPAVDVVNVATRTPPTLPERGEYWTSAVHAEQHPAGHQAEQRGGQWG